MGGEDFVRSLPLAPESAARGFAAVSRLSAVRLRLGFLLYLLWRVRKKIGRMLFDERWILLLHLAAEVRDVPRFTKLIPPAGRFWADPHVVAKDGVHYVYLRGCLASKTISDIFQ